MWLQPHSDNARKNNENKETKYKKKKKKSRVQKKNQKFKKSKRKKKEDIRGEIKNGIQFQEQLLDHWESTLDKKVERKFKDERRKKKKKKIKTEQQ